MNYGVTLKFGPDGQPILPDVTENLGDDRTLYGLAMAIENNLSHHNLVGNRVKVRAKLCIGCHGGLVLSNEDNPGSIEVEFVQRDVGFGKYLARVKQPE